MTTTQTPPDLTLTTTKGAGKSSKVEANYRDRPSGANSCAVCTMFRPPSSCTAVEGAVQPTGWCRYFEAKTGKSSTPWRNKLGDY
jgi:hypothetical protein